MQVKKKQLEQDMERWTGSQLGKGISYLNIQLINMLPEKFQVGYASFIK